MKTFLLIIIALAIPITLGNIVTDVLVHDNANIPAATRDCARRGLERALDNPFENLRVIKTIGDYERPDGMVVSTWTLYKIKLDEFLVVCDRSVERLT